VFGEVIGNVCFVRNDGKVLLLQRDREPMKGRWTGVGGKIKFHEEPLESCIREVKEETGLDVDPELAGIIASINRSTLSKWFLFVYVASSRKEELGRCHEGTLEWVDEKELHTKDLALIKVSLPYILGRKKKDIIIDKIVHDGKKVLSCTLREGRKILLEIP
jgi:8-oxo-dGTP pyrophosphatase MutT (NUDIX family)